MAAGAQQGKHHIRTQRDFRSSLWELASEHRGLEKRNQTADQTLRAGSDRTSASRNGTTQEAGGDNLTAQRKREAAPGEDHQQGASRRPAKKDLLAEGQRTSSSDTGSCSCVEVDLTGPLWTVCWNFVLLCLHVQTFTDQKSCLLDYFYVFAMLEIIMLEHLNLLFSNLKSKADTLSRVNCVFALVKVHFPIRRSFRVKLWVTWKSTEMRCTHGFTRQIRCHQSISIVAVTTKPPHK